jgi:cytochrome d ubiquinol oxidase subunit II
VLAGAVLLFPALALLFTLTLRGHLGGHGEETAPVATTGHSGVANLLLGPTLGARLAAALLIVGIGLLNLADAPWAHAIGVISLLAFILVAFAALMPRTLAEDA